MFKNQQPHRSVVDGFKLFKSFVYNWNTKTICWARKDILQTELNPYTTISTRIVVSTANHNTSIRLSREQRKIFHFLLLLFRDSHAPPMSIICATADETLYRVKRLNASWTGKKIFVNFICRVLRNRQTRRCTYDFTSMFSRPFSRRRCDASSSLHFFPWYFISFSACSCSVMELYVVNVKAVYAENDVVGDGEKTKTHFQTETLSQYVCTRSKSQKNCKQR